MIKSALTLIITIIMIVVLAGCSKGGNNPVNPAAIDNPGDSQPTVYISESIGEGESVPMIFGIYEVSIDANKLTGEIHPIRNLSALGDSVCVDATPFLTITPCADCIKLTSIAMDADGYFDVTFKSRHPFEPGNRLDLHVFDPRGIIVTGENTKNFNRMRIDMDGDGTYESPAQGNVSLIVDADGYTSFYDAVVEDFTGKYILGNISPFKNMWYNPATSSPDSNYNPAIDPEHGFTDLYNPSGHNVFRMGCGFDDPLSATSFKFDFAEAQYVNFLFIFEASYGVTSTRFTRKEPRYFLPEFHRKEALSVKVRVENNYLEGYNSLTSNTASVYVSVVDWQAGMQPTENWDYHTSPLTSLKYKSDVKNVLIDIPDILSTQYGFTLPEIIQGDGTVANPYEWHFKFFNELGVGPGTYWGLVAIRDDLEGSMNAPLGVSSDVIHPVAMHDITVYQSFRVDVAAGTNIPPVADVDANPTSVHPTENINVSIGPNAQDPDGTIVKYEYDFDYQVGDFVPDPAYTDDTPPFTTLFTYSYMTEGTYFLAQRVTDNLGATDIDAIEISVTSLTNESPVADVEVLEAQVYVNGPATITIGPLCMDPDGSIVKYEYDFDYQIGDFTPDPAYTEDTPPFTASFSYTYTAAGIFVVAQRVTDNGDATNIDTDSVEVLVVANVPPIAHVIANPSPVRVCSDVTVEVGPNCLDPDGQIIKYEYDFDYTPTPGIFTPDPAYTQEAGDPDFGYDVIYQYPAGSAGQRYIAQRVTDNDNATAIDFDPTVVTANVAPNADLGHNPADNTVADDEVVSFFPGPSTDDPDGVITLYEYDFNYTIGTFTVDASNTTGAAVPYQFNNPGVTPINQNVATRVTDDGCPNMQNIDYETFIINPPVTSGLPIEEHFETTAAGAVPINWAVVGKFGQSYYEATNGSGCSNNNWRWGVTVNGGQNDPSLPSEFNFLNENGFANSASDPGYTYQNRATIACTPAFIVPATGATLTVRHWFDFAQINDPGLPPWIPPIIENFDGGMPIISENLSSHPTTVSWSDFCYTGTVGSSPLNAPLARITGPAYGTIGDHVSDLHPCFNDPCHVLQSGTWVTSTYSIPAGSYQGQLVRVGFLFGSEDFDVTTNVCTYAGEPWGDSIIDGYGWRIEWMSIVAN